MKGKRSRQRRNKAARAADAAPVVAKPCLPWVVRYSQELLCSSAVLFFLGGLCVSPYLYIGLAVSVAFLVLNSCFNKRLKRYLHKELSKLPPPQEPEYDVYAPVWGVIPKRDHYKNVPRYKREKSLFGKWD